jgi:hypothetical protein
MSAVQYSHVRGVATVVNTTSGFNSGLCYVYFDKLKLNCNCTKLKLNKPMGGKLELRQFAPQYRGVMHEHAFAPELVSP